MMSTLSSPSGLLNRSPRELTAQTGIEAAALYATSSNGLSVADALQRLSLARNELPHPSAPGYARRFFRQFLSPLIAILLVAAVIMPFIGNIADTYTILVILLFNAAIGAYQEGRASRALESLASHHEQTTEVLRNHASLIIPIEQIVLGDIVVLREGALVPADGRIIEHVGLRIDESMLTGEDAPVSKTADPIPSTPQTPLGDLRNCAFRGSHVVAGHGLLLVTAVGTATELGKIAISLLARDTEPPLAKKINDISRVIAYTVGGFSTLLFLFGLIAGRPVLVLFATVVTLSVSIIPEGLPVVLTLVLARGVKRMADHHAIVKRLNAVEGLGNVDVICTDKTGTLTVNEQRIVNVVTPKDTYSVEGHGYEPHGRVFCGKTAIRFGSRADLDLLANAAFAFGRDALNKTDHQWSSTRDPVDAAFLAFALRYGTPQEPWQVLDERPFSFEERRRSLLLRTPTGGTISFLAGSPERVFAVCERDGVEQQLSHEDAAKKGLRVIALAFREGDIPLSDAHTPWTCLGYVAMGDEVRADAIPSVAWCLAQGIRVVMVTGDHPETALAIAQTIGIASRHEDVIRGDELDSMDDATLASRLDTLRVFARITPAHKLRIVNAYRSLGLLTAMTGDGVNDAPALHAADIGIAMGKDGTDVAREACDLVLMDNRFTTIVTAIQEGRSITGNVRKVLTYLLSTGVAEAIVIAVTLLSNTPIPLLPVQILWLNLITDGLLDVSLAMEPPHKRGKPRSGSFIDTQSLFRIVLLGGVMAGGTLLVYFLFLDHSITELRTLTLLVLATFQWFNAWSARSETTSILQISPFTNPYLITATCIVFLLQLLALYGPLAGWLGTAPLHLTDWLLAGTISLTVLLADEWWKHRFRRAHGAMR